MTTLEDVKEYWSNLSYCGCYTQEIEGILAKATKLYAFVESVPDEADGITIVDTPDGIYTVIESQDYTGHGCRCGSSVGAAESGPFKDLDAAIKLGGTYSALENLDTKDAFQSTEYANAAPDVPEEEDK